jgi:hypothetical protein
MREESGMSRENPIQTVRLCFVETWHLKEHFVAADDHGALDRLVAFLQDSDAVIADLEGFSDEENDVLRKAKGRDGHSLFSAPNFFVGGNPNRCARICPLKESASSDHLPPADFPHSLENGRAGA